MSVRCSELHVPSWSGTQSLVHGRILWHTMWASVEAGAINGREESAKVKNYGKIGMWVCVFPKYWLGCCSLPFLCLFTSRLSVQFVFCSFIWGWTGGFSLSQRLSFLLESFGMLFWMAKIKWIVPPCLCSVPWGPSLPLLPALGTLWARQWVSLLAAGSVKPQRAGAERRDPAHSL